MTALHCDGYGASSPVAAGSKRQRSSVQTFAYGSQEAARCFWCRGPEIGHLERRTDEDDLRWVVWTRLELLDTYWLNISNL